MNQNPGYFEAIWLFLWRWIQNSVLYRLLRRLYDGMAGLWQKSRIAGWFRKAHISEDAAAKSIFGKILFWPFSLPEAIGRRFAEPLGALLKKSRIIGLCRLYLHNVLALNLRFLGLLTLGCTAGCAIGAALSKTAVSPLPLLLAALFGIVLVFFDRNATDWLRASKLISFICGMLQIKPRYDWYDKQETEGKLRLMIAALAGLLCGLSGGLTDPLLGAAMLPAFCVFFLILERPIAGLYLLVFLAPLAPTMAMAGLAMLTLFSLMIYSITHRGFVWRRDGMGLLLFSFVLIYLLCATTSFARAKSLQIWAIYAVFIAAYFLVTNLITAKHQLWHLLVVFVISGFLVCLYGIAQYLFGWDTAQAWMDEEMFQDIKMRIYSTLENPNVLGEYILLVLPAAIGLMWVVKKPLARLTYAGIAAVMLLALILTFSRGCWIGLLLAAAVFITFAAGKLWGLALIAPPLLPAVLPQSILNRFTSIGNMEDSSTSYRVYIWMGTLAMIRDFWISGIGMGAEAFTQVYPFYSYNGIVAPHSHNLFLQILVESGVVGIVVFLLVLVLFFKKAMVGYQIGGGKGKPLSTLVCALCAGVCGFLIQGMFDNCFYNYRVMLIFWLTLGIAMAVCTVAAQLTAGEKEAFGC